MPRTLQSVFRGVYGKPAWQVRKGYGSGITFEFGKPKLQVFKRVLRPRRKAKIRYPTRLAYVHGEWGLWIFCCHWEIRQGRRRIGRSDYSEKRIAHACSVLNGQILTAVIVNPRTLNTKFRFDLGGQLRTWPYKGEAIEMWNLRCPSGRYFAFRSDGAYSYCPGHTKPDEKHWQQLEF